MSEQLRGLLEFGGWDSRNLRGPIGCPILNGTFKQLESHRVVANEIVIELSGPDDQVQQSQHHGQVGAGAWRKVNVRFLCGRGPPGINDEQLRALRTGKAVQHSCPEDRLRFRHVMTEEK